jgi:hypothetical protein
MEEYIRLLSGYISVPIYVLYLYTIEDWFGTRKTKSIVSRIFMFLNASVHKCGTNTFLYTSIDILSYIIGLSDSTYNKYILFFTTQDSHLITIKIINGTACILSNLI